MIAGLHVPDMPSLDEAGRFITPPLHTGATGLNVGTDCWFTATVICAVLAQAPATGVNVYVVVAVLLIAGDQVPLIPSMELAGNVKDPPAQIPETALNEGLTGWLTVMVICTGPLSHWFGSGVKV